MKIKNLTLIPLVLLLISCGSKGSNHEVPKNNVTENTTIISESLKK